MAQMLTNDVVRFGHNARLSQHQIGVNSEDRLLTEAAPDQLELREGEIDAKYSYRVSFLYFSRCGMMESWPSLRILSFS
jgi:hypothetical protein